MLPRLDLFKSEFFRNVSYQMVGTGVAQLIPFMASPLLTRLYTEDDFAVYTSFFAIASILAVGVGGRYQFAIVLPKKNSEAIRIFTLSIYLTIFYAIILLIAAWSIRSSLSETYKSIVFFIPPYVLIFGIWTSFSYLSVREKTFFHNASAKVLQSLLYIASSIALGALRVTSFGLVIGKISGVIISWLYLQRKSRIKFVYTKLRELHYVAKAYVEYPKYGFIPAFLDIASVQGIILILSKFYTMGELGSFGLTTLILSAPLGLISGSFKDVFYQKIVTLINRAEFAEASSFYKKSAIGLVMVGLPVWAIIFFFGPEIFSFVFGEQWVRSGEFASILSFSFLIQLVVSPLSSIFNAANKLKIASIWQTLYFFSTFLTLGVSASVLKINVNDLLYVYVVHEVILYSIYFLMQFWTLKRL
ncbi:MAG: hypothetical protein K8H85_00270 [Cyclobacteriaceae bacterium]|nr:hypothetical protein [Cyclobacteriaceae bacterium]